MALSQAAPQHCYPSRCTCSPWLERYCLWLQHINRWNVGICLLELQLQLRQDTARTCLFRTCTHDLGSGQLARASTMVRMHRQTCRSGNDLLGHQLPNGLLNVSCALSKGLANDPAC